MYQDSGFREFAMQICSWKHKWFRMMHYLLVMGLERVRACVRPAQSEPKNSPEKFAVELMGCRQ